MMISLREIVIGKIYLMANLQLLLIKKKNLLLIEIEKMLFLKIQMKILI